MQRETDSIPDDATARFIVDDRERDLLRAFSDLGVETTTRRLPLGDVLLPRSGAVVERKTLEDLAASIKDGRWREQRTRLLESGAPVFYIVEGVVDLSGRQAGGLPAETPTILDA